MMAILAPSSLDVQIPSMGSVAVSVISDLIDSSLQSGITKRIVGMPVLMLILFSIAFLPVGCASTTCEFVCETDR